MQQVIRVFNHLLPDFVEHVSEQIVAAHVPVYEHLPRLQVQAALYNAIHAIGVDLTEGTAAAYPNYWRDVALQRAQQGISPVHSMQVTYLSTEVMTSFLKYHLAEQPQALAWWLERMHGIVSLGMLVMTEARINALRQIGLLDGRPAGHDRLVGRPLGSADAPRGMLGWLPREVLHLHTLGQYRVWRGPAEIIAWERRSAQHLLGLLATWRHEWLERERICDMLWPDADAAGAEARFKAALHALSAALEPDRPPRTASAYVQRRGNAYRLAATGPHLRLDAARFEELLDRAASEPAQARELYERALALYQGDYLPNCIYADWAAATRERLLRRYLDGACRLAALELEGGRFAAAIGWCEAALARDPGCEAAYQTLMRAHAAAGDRTQLCRAYERCAEQLRREFGLPPLPATTAVYRRALETLP